MESNKTNFQQVKSLLFPEKKYIYVILIYSVCLGVLSLAVPISVQFLINTVVLGPVLLPLVTLSITLFLILLFLGIIELLEMKVAETLQRRFFARMSAEIHLSFSKSCKSNFNEVSQQDYANRFFDIITVQKSLVKLLSEGFPLLLKTCVGLLILVAYHPVFIAFDVLIILLIIVIAILFGKKGVSTSIVESKKKLKTARWLEIISDKRTSIIKNFFYDFSRNKNDQNINNYLTARENHFRVLFSQSAAFKFLYAFLSAILLGLVGWLVIINQLTISQLVAAELIVSTILASIAKLGKHLESYYDLAASIDKLYVFREFSFSKKFDIDKGSLQLSFDKVTKLDKVTGQQLDFNYNFTAGSNTLIEVKSFGALQNFYSVLENLSFDSGSVKIDTKPFLPKDKNPPFDQLVILDRPIVFPVTIIENLLGAGAAEDEKVVEEVLKKLGILEKIESFKEETSTLLYENGFPLNEKECAALTLARFILNPVPLLVLDLTSMEFPFSWSEETLNWLAEKNPQMTMLIFHRGELSSPNFRTLNLNEGGFFEKEF